VELVRVRFDDPLVAPLLSGLGQEYEVRYGANDELSLAAPEQFDPPQGCFLVLVDGDGTPVAGGGFRRHAPGVCEVKRMWTATAHRRRGHAVTVLTGLEAAARAAGYTELRLETGPAQPEAEALYVARGYRRIERFGPYPSALAFAHDLRVDGAPGDASAAATAG
jgi:ribosomal protein S18 acetylase RimI-like enzyme